jgi:multiple sugar transport system substrate-binding protein
MKKRIGSICLAALMMVSSVAMTGCGSKQASGDVKTIKIWSVNGHTKEYDLKRVDEFNTKIGKERGLKIEFKMITDANQMTELGVQTGDLPHLVDGLNLKTLVEKDIIIPITDLPGGQEHIDATGIEVPQNEECVFDGKVYSLPKNSGTRALIYNKEMFKKAGLVDENGEAKPPKSLEELREYAKILTNPEAGEYGLILPFKWQTCLEDWLGMAQQINGFGNYNPKTGLYDFSAYEPILQTMMDIKNDGSILPGSEGLDNDPARARFAEGGIGMKFAFYWDYGVLTTQFPAKIDWGVAPYPIQNEDGTRYLQKCGDGYRSRINKSVLTDIGGEDFMFFYDWWYSDEVMADMYAGGMDIPKSAHVAEKVTFADGEYTQWKELGDLLAISHPEPIPVKTETSGILKIQDDFLKSVWNGSESVADFVKRKEQEYNDGIKIYQERNPEYDPSEAIDMDWDISY